MRVVGIDPGQKGGVACIDGDRIVAVDAMPILDKCVDVRALSDLLSLLDPDHVVIEQQSIRPMQKGAMAIGSNYGRLLAMIEYHQLPHTIVTPATWNKIAGVTKGLTGRPKKEASFKIAKQTWGEGFDSLGIGISKDGMYEALLIARYGRKR